MAFNLRQSIYDSQTMTINPCQSTNEVLTANLCHTNNNEQQRQQTPQPPTPRCCGPGARSRNFKEQPPYI
eukprot:8567590-Lingulodinium_polyedra.AAC.1